MDAFIAMLLPEELQGYSTHMDFEGQKNAEKIYKVILTISGIIGFLIGYLNHQLSHSIYIVIGAALVSAFIILPAWPCFRRNPIKGW